jgi:RNA polymerase sigma-70 factor, ECF subfamily
VDGAGPGPSTSDVDREQEERLAAALEAGDASAALPLLMDRHGLTVYRYCRRMLGVDADGDDVSQIVFMQAFEAIGRRKPIQNVRAWLLGIARHRCLDRLDGRRRGPLLFDTEDLERMIDAEEPVGPAVGDPGWRLALEGCVDALDPRSRVAILLRFHDQLSYDSVSKLTGDGSGALRVRVARALRALRRCMEKKGETR